MHIVDILISKEKVHALAPPLVDHGVATDRIGRMEEGAQKGKTCKLSKEGAVDRVQGAITRGDGYGSYYRGDPEGNTRAGTHQRER